MCSRRFEDVSSETFFCFPRRLQDVFKTCLQDVFLKTSLRCLKDVLKKTFASTSWRGLEDVLERVLKTSVSRFSLVKFHALASQIPFLVTATGIHYISYSCKYYQTYLNGFVQSHIRIALMNLHHDVANNHTPGFDYLNCWWVFFGQQIILSLYTKSHARNSFYYKLINSPSFIKDIWKQFFTLQ